MKHFGDEKLTTRWFWSKSQQKHSARVKEIKEKTSLRLKNSPPKLRRNSIISQKFHEDERKTEIHRENIKLLDSLTDISFGRRSSSTHLILDSVRGIPKPRSLNIQARIQESKRILSDNEAIAKRLLKTTNGVSFKKLDVEWQNVVKYKKTISKAKFRALPKSSEKGKVSNLTSSSEVKSNGQTRAHSMHEPPMLSLYTREFTSNFSMSPILQTHADLAMIDRHKPNVNFCVNGQKKKVLKKRLPGKLAPIKTS